MFIELERAMTRWWMRAAGVMIAVALIAAACGGDDDDNGDSETPEATAEATSGVTPSTTNTSGGQTTPTLDSDLQPIATGDSASAGQTFTLEQAQSIVTTVPLTPDDLPSRWMIGTDTTTDAATAKTNNPENAASIDRCQQLLSRLVVNSPVQEDLTSRYLGGENVSYFTTVTVFATDEGATDCGNEAAARFTDCLALATVFGTVFVDPAAVVCEPVEFPQVGAGSFATNLTGTVSAGGFDVTVTILIVAWRQGNVSAVVGSAAAEAPDVADLHGYVGLVAQRIADAQGGG
jgi:hypothetical protein